MKCRDWGRPPGGKGASCDERRPEARRTHSGVVGLLDIACCQMFCRAASGGGSWARAQRCDVDGSAGIRDLVEILRNFT